MFIKIESYLASSPLFSAYCLSEKLFVPFQKGLKKEGFTFIQSMVLTAIYFEQTNVRPSQLASSLRVSPSNVSHAVRILVQKGLIRKKPEASDERVVNLQLTPGGVKRVHGLIKIYNEIQTHFEEQMGERPLLNWNKRSQQILKYFWTFGGLGFKK